MKAIIDMHTHIFPEDVLVNWNKYAQRDSYFKQLTNPRDSLQQYATIEETLELADKAGIQKIVMQGWYWNDHELCKYHNDFMYELINKYPDRFAAFASINPTFGELAIAELERSYNRGFVGIGEIGPGANNFELTDNRFLSLMEAADHFQLPVTIHCSAPVGHNYLGRDRTSISDFYNLVCMFPNLVLILAHLGGGLPFYELMPRIKAAFKNVYYDLAANPLVYETKSIRHVVDIVGSDKILFGSDFPLLLYPRNSREKEFQSFINDIYMNARLNKEEWNKVMSQNAKRLLS